MTFELCLLGWTLVLAFVQILLFDVARTGQYGLKWNTGARDETMPPLSPMANRLKRAQDNLFETLPLFIGAVLVAHLAGKNGDLTHWGALIYLVGRVAYVPLYAFGVKQIRSLVWLASTAGLLMIFWAILAH
ncbi:MAG: MAPEG family protein [Caulobacter sp.]|nr:MAPEG family protein [Caulobacter sp.]